MTLRTIVARLRAAVFFVDDGLTRCGEACCVGRSQFALRKTVVRDDRGADYRSTI
jgi:hypothetical protein